MTEPQATEKKAPKKRGGKRPYTVTNAARDYERAKAELARTRRQSGNLEALEARLQKAQDAYDKAVEAQEANAGAITGAEQKVADAKKVLDAALAGDA